MADALGALEEPRAREAAEALGKADDAPVSLGDGGYAVVTFDKPITNGPGYDFAVFENGLNDSFLELAFVVVSWTDWWDNGAAITSYTVTSSPGGKTCTTGGGNGTCTVTGLVNGKAYTFTVTATNPLGTSPASAPTAPVTPHA